MLSSEDEYGNIEYKLKVIPKNNFRLEQLVSQMKWRISEGNGTAYYYLGVKDDGKIINISNNEFKDSILNLKKISSKINSSIRDIKKMTNDKYYWYKILVKKNIEKINEYRIMFIGPTQVGKSTLISNIVNNTIDDGNGKSRRIIFNHKHEIYSGVTSSISIEKLEIKKQNSRSIFYLIDTPGYKKYIKTTITSILKYNLNFIYLCIDPNNLIIDDINFFIKLIVFSDIKYQIIFTKTDILEKSQILKISKLLDIKLSKIRKKNYIKYYEVNNLNMNYTKLINSFKKISLINKNSKILIQCTNIIKIPNIGKVLVAILNEKINLDDSYYLSDNESINNKINLDTIYYLDKSVYKINGYKIITIKLNKNINFLNKSNIILTKNKINNYKKLVISCNENITEKKCIVLYNNQYIISNIKKVVNNLYELSYNLHFINLDEKIIIKINNKYLFCKLVEKY